MGVKKFVTQQFLPGFLIPRGTHGFGRLPLQAFLRAIRHNRNDIPEDYLNYCRVQVETNPTGDNTNRIDIEIDADNFFLLIEVKIDAYEQRNKLPDIVVMPDYAQCHVLGPLSFLTPHGGKPLTCGLDFKPEDVPVFPATSRHNFRVFVANRITKNSFLLMKTRLHVKWLLMPHFAFLIEFVHFNLRD